MPQNALDNPLVLPILGLLVEQPRHQYALLRDLRVRYPFLRAKTSTVYTLVASLERGGLVAVDSAGPQERQPVSLTARGFGEFQGMVERQFRDADPSGDPRFLIALAYLGALGRERAALLLRGRAEDLRDEHKHSAALLAGTDVSELHMIEVHFLAARFTHDAAWLDAVADRIDRGELAWPAD
jgi:DNA-binding PadR family transcriptional regulator